MIKRWVGLVSKNYEIECAIVELEKELIELKKVKQQQNTLATQSEQQHDEKINEDGDSTQNGNNVFENNTNSDESN